MSVKAFRRYTNLAAVVHLLQAKAITLLNPATWDDTNDAYFMAEYKRLKQAKTVLALCFAETAETYHHWRVFSHGADGVCLEFNKIGYCGLGPEMTPSGPAPLSIRRFSRFAVRRKSSSKICPSSSAFPTGTSRSFG